MKQDIEKQISEIIGKQKITIVVNANPGKSHTEITYDVVAELLSLFSTSVEEIIGGDDPEVPSRSQIDKYADWAVNNAKKEQRKRLAKLLKG